MTRTELYVHIPFCVRKCAYCDFLSAPADEGTRARYLAGLFDEFKSWGQRAKGRNITSVFVGGGTPTSLSAKQLDGLFCALRDTFDIPKAAEVTVECNPGTLDGEKLSVLKNAGVNRLSIGLQSADNA